MTRHRALLILPTLLACSPEPTPAAPGPDASASANEIGASAKAIDASVPTPGEPSPKGPPPEASPKAPEVTSEPPPSAPVLPATSDTLRLIGMREGRMGLRGGAVVMDGEPLVRTSDSIARGPGFGRGLAPVHRYDDYYSTLDFIGDPQGVAFVTSATSEGERAMLDIGVYERKGERWSRLALGEIPLRTYYPSFVRRGEALLGLAGYIVDVEYGSVDEDGEVGPPPPRPDPKPAFVHLAGTRGELPKLPKGTYASRAVTTDDGTLYAVTEPPPSQPPDYEEDEDWRPRLLVWAPNETKPTTLELPGLETSWTSRLSITAAGEHALIGSMAAETSRPYLALAKGTTLENIGASFVAPEESWGMVRSATRSPSGEVFMVVGEFFIPPEQGGNLWRLADGKWAKLPLPSPASAGVSVPAKRWWYETYSGMWAQTQTAPASDREPLALEVDWREGALWVVADLGPAFEEAREPGMQRRHGLYTNRVGTSAPVWLPSFDALLVERLSEALRDAKPGDEGCYGFSLVFDVAIPPELAGDLAAGELAAPELAALGLDEAKLTALASSSTTDGYSDVRQLYVGEAIDEPGKRELVLLVQGEADADASLRERVRATLGLTTRADCRPRQLVRMVRAFATPER